MAATAGHEKVVETLLKHNAELEAQSERTKDTPLSLACSGGRYEVVELLLNVGANKEHRNVSDYTPLSLAASGGYVNIIKLLLSHGAEINSRTGSKLGISPLMLAAMNGHTAAVKLLLDMGSDINAQIETNRNTALTLACFQGRHEVVSLLLERKANVEHRAKTGLTPLMEAASGGYIEVGRVLLDKGADVNAAPVPSSRDTALTIAADKGHIKFVELLLNRHAAVEVKNKKGNSPLWLAANGGHLQVVEVLYNSGADIDSQDNRKVSCLMAAFRKGHTKVVKWMVNHVTQFPSDQEMTRYISTVSDKDLLDKCHECVKIIRAAKEAQAVKANKNASILLAELNIEKSREESRRAAAARRRERKKKKKLEKKEKKKSELSTTLTKDGNSNEIEDRDDDDDDEDEDDDKDDDSDKEEIAPMPRMNNLRNHHPQQQHHNPHQPHEREEGDSGIDANSHSSCSSADTKNIQNEKSARNNKNKKKKNGKDRNSKSPETLHEQSPPPASQPQAQPPKKKEEINSSSSSNSNNNQNKSVKTPAKSNSVEPVDQKSQPVNNPKSDNRKDNKNKENIIPAKTAVKSVEKVVGNSSRVSPPTEHASSNTTNIRKSLVFESGNKRNQSHSSKDSTDTVDNSQSNTFPSNSSDMYFKSNTANKKSHDDSNHAKTITSPKQPGNATGKREDGWKEVVRKSSLQQQTTTPAPVETQGIKKVQVSTHAISRVIGRAGSNINAIRAATGAHIEVEKQGKAQGDRSITIKGSPDAVKQASNLIGTLIKDPDVDILTMLPRPNMKPSVPSVPTGTSIWQNSAPLPSTQSIPPLMSVPKPLIAPKTNTLPSVISSSSIAPTTKTVTVATSSSTMSSTIISSTRSQNVPKLTVYVPSQNSRNLIMSNQSNSTIVSKRGTPTPQSGGSSSSSSSGGMSHTKQTMSINTTSIKNTSNKHNGSSNNNTSTAPGTFASKLLTSPPEGTNNSGVMNSKKDVFFSSVQSMPSSSTTTTSSIIQSPKHQGNNSQSGLPAPFTSSSINTSSNNSISNNMPSSQMSVTYFPKLPPFSQSSAISVSGNQIDSNIVAQHRPITPIGPPQSANRNVSSPLLMQTSSVGNNNISSLANVSVSSSSAPSTIHPPVAGNFFIFILNM